MLFSELANLANALESARSVSFSSVRLTLSLLIPQTSLSLISSFCAKVTVFSLISLYSRMPRLFRQVFVVWC